MAIDIRAQVRKFQKLVFGDIREVRLTAMQSLAAAQVEDKYAELCRAGRRYHGGLQVLGNGQAPTISNVTGQLVSVGNPVALYNNDLTKSYVIDRVGYYLASGTAAQGSTLILGICGIPGIPSANTGSLPAALAGYGSQSSSGSFTKTKAIWTSASAGWISSTSWDGAANYYCTIEGQNNPAAANLGQGVTGTNLEGRFIVPPNGAAVFDIRSGAGSSALFGVGCMWSELELDLE